MPRIVDHDEKRRKLAEAAWRIISREGLEAVSVRKVANEANMSLGSMRHYFDSQSKLMEFSMNLVSERIHERFARIEFTQDPIDNLRMIIEEIMPVDQERRVEGEVWLSFIGRAIYDRSIQALSMRVHEELEYCFRRMIGELNDRNLLKEDIDLENEIKRLHALVDGLSVHNLIYPEVMTAERMLSVIKYHLEQIMTSI